MTMNLNPLLQFDGLARFDAVRAEHVSPALDVLLQSARAAVERAADPQTPASWDSFVAPLEESTEQLRRSWGIVGHLNAVVDTPEMRATYNDNLPRMTEFWTAVGQDERLFAKYRALRQDPSFDSLSPARKQIIEHALRDFRLGGAELPADDKPRYAAIQERAAQLSQKYSENLLDATNDYALVITDEARLTGLPDDAKQAAAAAASADQPATADGQTEPAAAASTAWKFTLQFPSYFPVMQYAEDRALRETLYHAYATRASEFGPAERNNRPLIDEILQLRAEEAKLLGYQSFAQLSLVPKMAESPEQVMTFLRELAGRARPYAERDLQQLRAFAAAELGLPELKSWDVSFASEKLRQARYAFSDHEVKQYFPLPRVLNGLFGLVQSMFGVTILPDQTSTWHPDVQFFRIERTDTAELVGQFYIDLYARRSKRGGAWMDDQRGRCVRADGVQTPVAYLVCNFTPPVGGKPAVLTHDEVITLFHEAGHGLHHLLTRVDDLGVSGINGVEWDAVELPSQFLENFCWEWPVLQAMTGHVDTGEPLPRALYDRMIAAKNFQAGLMTLRQIEFALFDMELHSDAEPGSRGHVRDVLQRVRQEVAVMLPPDYNRFENSFSHIFAGGYAAGYYSYKWAEVLSADVYASFEEAGLDNPETGRRYLNEILSVGGSRPALESFRAFRGRDPSIDALLRHNGMSDDLQAA